MAHIAGACGQVANLGPAVRKGLAVPGDDGDARRLAGGRSVPEGLERDEVLGWAARRWRHVRQVAEQVPRRELPAGPTRTVGTEHGNGERIIADSREDDVATGGEADVVVLIRSVDPRLREPMLVL